MIFYKILLAFKGSRYLGWQKQKDFSPTVQDELERILANVFKTDGIKTVGSGRTDTGVHSLGHVVKVKAPFAIAPESLVKALNSSLPPDIRALEAAFCDKEFRPTNDALRKEYRYLFTNNKAVSPFQIGLLANYPFELDFDAMKAACEVFVGTHDFKDFSCKGSDPSSTVRTVFECELTTDISPQMQGVLPEYHCLRIVGSGFLKQMVRLVMGSLWHVGRGKIDSKEIKMALESGSEKRLGEVAPPEGLYKYRTWY